MVARPANAPSYLSPKQAAGASPRTAAAYRQARRVCDKRQLISPYPHPIRTHKFLLPKPLRYGMIWVDNYRKQVFLCAIAC